MDVHSRKVNNKEKWIGLMKRTLSHLNRRKALPQEWLKFSDLQTSLLLNIQNPEVTYDTLHHRFPLLSMFQDGSSDYVHLCIRVCFDANPMIDKNEKFLSLYLQVLEWIREESLLVVTHNKVEEFILCHLVENENIEALRTMLSIKEGHSNQKEPFTVSMANIGTSASYGDSMRNESPNVEYNYSPLIRACEKNNFNVIQIFVSAGYRYD